MSDYESIRGTRVKYLTSDPTLNSSTEGQVWYNSTEGTLRALVQIKAWSSGGNLSTARYHSGPATSAPSTAGMVAAGFSNSSPETATNVTEEYNGFSWSSGGNVNTARANLGGAGIQTAALIFGGYSGAPNVGYNLTEEYDGSAWTSGGTLPVNTSLPIGAGTQTAGLSIGGLEIGVAALTTTNLYNGTAWTSTGHNINDDGYGGAGVGTSTAALIMGGDGRVSSVESYDGSSWTAVTNLVSANGRNAGAGTNTFANCFGGSTNPTANQTWDGNTWVSVTGLSTGRARLMGFGTATQSVAAGGYTTTQLANTEEYNSNINAFTSASFASGGNLSNSRAQFGSAKHGTQNAGLAFGGYVFGPNANRSETEEYGGTSWTSGGALPGGQRQMGGTGTQTAALSYGGLPGIPNTTTLEYDGSSWTSGGALPAGMSFAVNSAAGTQTAALRAGSGPGAATTTTQEYDGSTWTSANAMSIARTGAYFDGAQTAAIITAGEAPAAPDATGSITRLTEEYDGTDWSSGASSIFFLAEGGVSGGAAAPTALMITGGNGPEVTNNTGATQEYDGTAFTNTANLATSRRQLNGGGTQAAGLVFGGTEASVSSLTATEEYTGTTSIVTASTLTTS